MFKNRPKSRPITFVRKLSHRILKIAQSGHTGIFVLVLISILQKNLDFSEIRTMIRIQSWQLTLAKVHSDLPQSIARSRHQNKLFWHLLQISRFTTLSSGVAITV